MAMKMACEKEEPGYIYSEAIVKLDVKEQLCSCDSCNHAILLREESIDIGGTTTSTVIGRNTTASGPGCLKITWQSNR